MAIRNAIIATLLIAVCLLAYIDITQSAANKTLQTRLERLNTAAGLELQEKCAKQAFEVFKMLGYSANGSSGFADHYNQKLNRCFVEIGDTTVEAGSIRTSSVLSDAFGGKRGVKGDMACVKS